MICLFLHTNHLKISEVAKILGLKDNRSAKNWLRTNNISISKIGGKNVINEFLFHFKREQLFVENLIKDYPICWFEIYDAKTNDKGMVKSILALYPKTKAAKKNSNNHIKKYIE